MALPIGKVLDSTNPELVAKLDAAKAAAKQAVDSGAVTLQESQEQISKISEEIAVQYNYTAPLVMLAFLGVAAFVLGLALKVVDRKKNLGLEQPNIKN